MVTQKFDLNMIPGKPKPIIRASQYDTGLRAFEVSLFAGTDTYTITSGATLTVQGTKPDYTGFSYSATYSGNTVTFDCTDQMTACAGAVEVEIVVVSEGERVATANFVLQVEPAALKDDTIISETDIPIIEQLPEMMEDVNTLISRFGSPNVARTAAEMTDTNKVYVYIGSETGYEYGHWYYHDPADDTWKSGGVYQSAGVDVDTTLSVAGVAADAKATGDKIESLVTGFYPKATRNRFIATYTSQYETGWNWESGGKTEFYDVLPGDVIEIVAGEYPLQYSYASNIPDDESAAFQAVIFASGFLNTLAAGASVTLTVPAGVYQLTIQIEDTDGHDTTPVTLTRNGTIKGIADLSEDIDEINTALDGKQDTLTFDPIPTEGSTNPVTSGGAWEAVQTDKTLAVEDKAADAKTVGLVTTVIRNEAESAAAGRQGLRSVSNWQNGGLTLNSDKTVLTINANQKYRVSTLDNIEFEYDTVLSIKAGFRIVLITYVNGKYHDQGWKTGTVIIPRKTKFVLIIARATDITGSIADIAEFTSSVTMDTAKVSAIENATYKIDSVTEHTKNILDPGQTLNLYLNASDILVYTNALCSVWIECKPNTKYTVSKPAGTRFAVATTKEFPADSVVTYDRLNNYTGTTITIVTSADAKYLIAWIYNSTDDLTFEEMLSGTQIEEADEATEYAEPFTAVDTVARGYITDHFDGKIPIVNNGDVASGSNLDDIKEDGYYIIAYSLSVVNAPEPSGRRMLFVMSGGVNPNCKKQIFINITTGSIYGRDFAGGAWEAWAELGNKSAQEICGLFDGRIAFSHGGIPGKTAYQNSPRAFKNARRLGIFYNDIDVTFTSDYIPIVVHDSQVVPYGETDPVVFRNVTYAELQEYRFGDAEYTWKLQTLKEAYDLNQEIGCKIGVDIGYLTSGAMPKLLTYMRNNGIKPIYLVSSELTTFNQFVANEAYDFPLGMVFANVDSAEYVDQKFTALLNMQNEQKLPKAWAFFRHEMIEDENATYYSRVPDLLEAGISIEFYSFNTLAEIENAKIPSFVSAWGGDRYNVNYERYKIIMSE